MQGPFVGAKDGKYRYGYDVRDAICAPVGGRGILQELFFVYFNFESMAAWLSVVCEKLKCFVYLWGTGWLARK